MIRSGSTRRVGDSRVLLLVVSLGAILVGLLSAMYVSSAPRAIDTLMSLGVIAIALTSIVGRILRRQFDLFEPIVGASVTMALLFGVRPLYMIARGSFNIYGRPIETDFAAAVGLGLLGMVSFVVAYHLFRPRQDTAANRHNRRDPLLGSGAATILGVGAALLGAGLFLLHLISLGPLSAAIPLWLAGRSNALMQASAGASEYLVGAPILAACGATAIGVVSRWRLTPPQRLLVVALVAFPVLVFLAGGDRRFVIPSVAVPVLSYYLATGRRPGRFVFLVVLPVAFVGLATIPFARSSGAREQANGALPIYQEALSAPADAWDRFITSFDTDMVAVLAVEVHVLTWPEDFYYGRATFGDLLIAPIPSAIFPGKPTTARNEMLTRAFGGPCLAHEGGLCPDFSAIGTFYQDLGWLGVAIGMGTLGAWSRRVWSRCIANPHSISWNIVAASWCIACPILIRAGFNPAFQWWLYFLVPTMVIASASVALERHLVTPSRQGLPR